MKKYKKKQSWTDAIDQDCEAIMSSNSFDFISKDERYDSQTNVLKVGNFNVKLVKCPNNVLSNENDIIIVNKSQNSGSNVEIAYGPPIYMASKIDKKVDPVIYTFKKKELKKTNIHDLRVTPNTASFYLSFLKDKECKETYLYKDDEDNDRALTISIKRNDTDHWGFRSFSLNIFAGVPNYLTKILDIKIPDSYKCFSDCVAYMHGIYRDNKEDVYKVVVDLNNGNLESFIAKAE